MNPWVGKIPWRRAWQPTAVFLPGESPWTEEPGGIQSTGLQRVRQDKVTKHTHLQKHLKSHISSLLCVLSGKKVAIATKEFFQSEMVTKQKKTPEK